MGFEMTGADMRVGAVLGGSINKDVIIQIIDHKNPDYMGSVIKTDGLGLEYLEEEMELCKLMCT